MPYDSSSFVSSPIDWPAWIQAVTGLISPFVALLVAWKLSRRDSLQDARLQAMTRLAEHTWTLRAIYQRLMDESISPAKCGNVHDQRKSDFLNELAKVATLVSVDRAMVGMLLGADDAKLLCEPADAIVLMSNTPGNLQKMDDAMREQGRRMADVAKRRFRGT